jgi:predicted AAA+ superfamily ATPase
MDRPVVFDEVQYVPGLFTYLKLRIDAQRERNGHFLMSGSQQFQLMQNISDSLAGRIAILDLLPFSTTEVPEWEQVGVAEAIWRGGYPPVALAPARRETWLSAYLQTYVERDVRQLLAVKDLRLFETFLGLCAARHGQELNLAEVGRDCGVSQPTCREWLSVLEASYVLRLLPPYFRNLGKRLTKTPKAYFVDSALAAYLARQPSSEALWHGAAGGAFFEGWAVLEAVKAFAARGLRPEVYFWRSHDGLEVDLLILAGGKVHGIELKQTATPSAGHAQGLAKFRLLASAADCGEILVVCTVGERTLLPGGAVALPWREFPAWLENVLR